MVSKIVCLGDSITWGYPYGPGYSWVDLSSRATGIPIANRGVNGDTAEDLALRFDRDVKGLAPSHVFIMAGTNDAAVKVSLDLYANRVSGIVEQAQASRIIPILGLPMPTSDRWLEYALEKYRSWLKEYGVKKGITVLDFSPAMMTPVGEINNEMYMDEVHPSTKGYQSMSGVFVNFLKDFCVL